MQKWDYQCCPEPPIDLGPRSALFPCNERFGCDFGGLSRNRIVGSRRSKRESEVPGSDALSEACVPVQLQYIPSCCARSRVRGGSNANSNSNSLPAGQRPERSGIRKTYVDVDEYSNAASEGVPQYRGSMGVVSEQSRGSLGAQQPQGECAGTVKKLGGSLDVLLAGAVKIKSHLARRRRSAELRVIPHTYLGSFTQDAAEGRSVIQSRTAVRRLVVWCGNKAWGRERRAGRDGMVQAVKPRGSGLRSALLPGMRESGVISEKEAEPGGRWKWKPERRSKGSRRKVFEETGV
ncbi:hypothetical protein DFH09DRAFT_1277535 [Mycena vulgaris]|nr:hypothetical protein DFH09DRAFT_1277535 [Mycena vulgaris]